MLHNTDYKEMWPGKKLSGGGIQKLRSVETGLAPKLELHDNKVNDDGVAASQLKKLEYFPKLGTLFRESFGISFRKDRPTQEKFGVASGVLECFSLDSCGPFHKTEVRIYPKILEAFLCVKKQFYFIIMCWIFWGRSCCIVWVRTPPPGPPAPGPRHLLKNVFNVFWTWSEYV